MEDLEPYFERIKTWTEESEIRAELARLQALGDAQWDRWPAYERARWTRRMKEAHQQAVAKSGRRPPFRFASRRDPVVESSRADAEPVGETVPEDASDELVARVQWPRPECARSLAGSGGVRVLQPLEGETVVVREDLDALTVRDAMSGSRVLLQGAVRGALRLERCRGVVVVGAAAQVRVKGCTDCDLYVHALTAPVLEASHGVRLRGYAAYEAETNPSILLPFHPSETCAGMLRLEDQSARAVNFDRPRGEDGPLS